MKFIKQLAITASLLICLPLLATADLLVAEAEISDSVGSSMTTQTDNSATPVVGFVTVETENFETARPGSVNEVITYALTFTSAGEYDLYARVRNGAGEYSDDSFYVGNGFGIKDVTNAEMWTTINGLAGQGYTDPTAVVGIAGSDSLHQVWKWVKISGCCGATDNTFKVPDGALIQDFQIAGREDGLDIDKFVFAPVGSELTVAELDSGVAATP